MKRRNKRPRYIRLSYKIGKSTPLYPGTPGITIKKIKDISKGCVCNTSLITFSNHIGTHVDAPAHFWNSGKSISDYHPEDLIFKRPIVVDCPKGPAGIIEIDDFKKKNLKGADSVLIRTRFSRYRNKNALLYCRRNPRISPGLAQWIRENFSNIRLIGIDCISISSYEHAKSGEKAHRILLSNRGFEGKPVLIIEDLYLPDTMERLDELIVSPIFIEEVDSAPCSVTGVVYN